MTKSLDRNAPNNNILNFSDEPGSEAHASAISDLSRGEGELSTGTEMEHVDEHDGGSVEEDDVKDD